MLPSAKRAHLTGGEFRGGARENRGSLPYPFDCAQGPVGMTSFLFLVGAMPEASGSGAYLAEDDFGVAEMLGDQAADERLEGLTGFGEHKLLGGLVPIQFETGGKSGNPYLADGSVGGENEFGGRLVEADVEDAVLFFHLKVGIGLGKDERFFQGLQSAVRVAPKGDFVDHRASVPTFPPHRMHVA